MKYFLKFVRIKRIIQGLLLCVLLGGCNAPVCNRIDPITNFKCDAVVKLQDNTINCELFRSVEGISEITVTEPPELEGLKFKWLGDSYALSYKGLSCETQTPSLPDTSFSTSIINVLNEISKSESLSFISSQKGYTTYSGECNSGKFKVSVEDSTGFIQEIRMDDSVLMFTFTNYS